MYKFDLFGWYDGEGEGQRTTAIAPSTMSMTTTPGQTRANFTGHEWVDLPYQMPVIDAPVSPAPPQFTSLEFLDLFTEAEQLAVVQATMVSAEVKLWYDRTLAASFITIEDPRTDAGLSALVGAGLLTSARKDEIVSEMSD